MSRDRARRSAPAAATPSVIPPLPRPRGPLMSAAEIVRRFFTTESGVALVTDKWVRDTVAGKIRLSHSKVAWFRDDVIAWIECRRVASGGAP